jgi:DNA polymerase V
MVAKVKTVHTPDFSVKHRQSCFEALVSAGFPSPAADYEESTLDLNKYLVRRPAATFFIKVAGDSMIGAGIGCGDLLVVDRSLEAKDKNVVIAAVNGELTVKRIRMRRGKITLEPENGNFAAREITGDTQFEVWGVVTGVIHKL